MSQSPQLECGGGVGEGVSGTVANDDCRYCSCEALEAAAEYSGVECYALA